MKPLISTLGVLLAVALPGGVAHAKNTRICVDVHIRSAKSLVRKKPMQRAQVVQPRRTKPRPRPTPARVNPRPTGDPATTPVETPRAGGEPATGPSRAAREWADAMKRRRAKRAIYRRGWDAGMANRDRQWRKYLLNRKTKRYPYPPAAYLRRLVEHYVTHAKGYLAVTKNCTERITLEMYPIKGGWTVFARNSKRAREEKVDLVTYEEFTRFAERVALSLLQGKHIAATANLKNILKADSMRDYRTIKGSHHFTMTLGSAFKIGYLPTYNSTRDAVENQVRALAPMTFSIGYRGRFNAWGIDASMRGGVGLQRESALRNMNGGHVDLDGLWSLGLQFLRYTSPHGMNSFYFGGGAIFDLTVFTAIKPETERNKYDRVRLAGGGLNLSFVMGVEFMRASAAQFFLQIVISAPVYPFELGTRTAAIKAYIPEVAATVGIMF